MPVLKTSVSSKALRRMEAWKKEIWEVTDDESRDLHEEGCQ